MARRTVAIVLIAAGLLLGLGIAIGKVRQPFAPVMALLLFCLGGMLIPGTYEVAAQLRPWLGNQVHAKAWGRGLPAHGTVTFRFDRTMAFGAGLHLYLQPQDGSKPLHLKIAQPKEVVLGDHAFEVGVAKYVQWCGNKVKRVPGEKAFVLQRRNKNF